MAAGSFVRIFSLLWADILVAFALFVMQNYLTNVWKVSLTHAAGIMNVYTGLCSILPVLFLFLVDSFFGNFKMLVLSSISYTAGICFIFLSTPPVLANSLGTCKEYEPECIGQTQKNLLYAGLALVAVGISGNEISLKPFLAEQKDNPEDQWQVKSISQIPGMILVAVVAVVGAIGLPYVKPWSLRFGIPAICTLVATILFLTGCCWHKYKSKPRRGNSSKLFLWMLPMWMTFLVCGVVSSMGNAYFVAQANHMNRSIGKWNPPLQVFLLIFKSSKAMFGKMAEWVLSGIRKQVGVALAMIFSILCCIIAAVVETKRRGVITSHSLLDKPNADIPMSVYWLLFQFVLLAGLDSFLENSIKAFCDDLQNSNEEHKDYLKYFTKAMTGLGMVGSLLSVYAVGRISERGGRTNWFQFTLNKSRLDNYYWVLAGMSSANLVVYIFTACCYGCMNLM